MIELLLPEDRARFTKICQKWSQDNLSVQEIKDTIGLFKVVINIALVKSKNRRYPPSIVSQLSILIDDILEMDSISNEEKDKEILELIAMHKDELQSLAKKAIAQIEIDVQEYMKQAADNGYCSELMKKS